MKKIFKNGIQSTMMLIILCAISTGNANAQGMPVYDNINFISFAKQLLEAGKQTSNIIKTMKFLKEQKENIDKVSGAIKQLKAIKQIIQNNERLYRVMQQDLRDILNSPYVRPEEINRISDSFNAIVENGLNDLDFIDQLLSNDLMKMTDAERAEMLAKKELESKKMVSDIHHKTKRYRDIISFRKMQHRINNREANY